MSDDLSELIGNADAFPMLARWDFLNHAGVCPLPRCAADAMRNYATQAETDSYLVGTWYRDIDSLRITSAAMLNAHRDEIAFIKNTSEGLSIVANGIDFQPGDRIVTTAIEYPANIYPWMDIARRKGCELILVPEEASADGTRFVPLDKIIAAASHPKTKVVTLSHVEYASGQRLDIAMIGKLCREQDKLFCVDAIQSLGVLPVDVRAMNIDYLAADGHKWLLGPEGAGVLYVRRELIEKTPPLTVGWMSVINPQEYGNYDFTLKPDAGKYECGTYNVPGLHGLKAAVDLLNGAGVEAVSARLKLLTDYLIERLIAKGYTILSPRSEEQWSGIVSFASPVHAHQPIWSSLRKEHRIEIALREGRLRCSAHFYNTEAQLDRLVMALPGH